MNQIIQGDCIEEMKKLEPNSVDAIITDPPYGLQFMGKEWDTFKEYKEKPKTERTKRIRYYKPDGTPVYWFQPTYLPKNFEFMGKNQDNKNELMENFFYIWAIQCLRVLKPGGYLLSFGGTRTYHRMTCGIEDAGFEIRDTIMWLYGSGFPKSLNIGKQIDKMPNMLMIEKFRKRLNEIRKEKRFTIKQVNEHFNLSSRASHWFGNTQPEIPTKEQWKEFKKWWNIDNYNQHTESDVCGDSSSNISVIRDLKQSSEKSLPLDVDCQQTTGGAGGLDVKASLKPDVEEISPFPDADLDKLYYEAERQILQKKWRTPSNKPEFSTQWGFGAKTNGHYNITSPNTKEAKEWEGWGTALKPACEPIVVARKPLSEKNVALNVLKHGTGGINIDACRVGLDGMEIHKTNAKSGLGKKGIYGKSTIDEIKGKDLIRYDSKGRFPANIILDEEAGKMLDEQSGINLKSGLLKIGHPYGLGDGQNVYGKLMGFTKSDTHADKGGASRFFKRIDKCEHLNKEFEIDEKRFFCGDCQKWIGCEDLEDNIKSRFFYCPKASKSERNFGCEEMEQKDSRKEDGSSKSLEIFSNQYTESSGNPIGRGITSKRGNNHPTVKPIKLMEYLIKLITRKNAIVLDPFIGSGTTAIACIKLNRKYIGIEKEQEYIKIANARIKPYLEQTKL